jgi:hypothetical protein
LIRSGFRPIQVAKTFRQNHINPPRDGINPGADIHRQRNQEVTLGSLDF